MTAENEAGTPEQNREEAAPPKLEETGTPEMNSIDPLQTRQITEYKYAEPLTSLRVDPTGRFVVAGALDLDIQLWNLDSGTQHTLKGHDSWVRSFDFSADGNLLYSACWGGNVKVWDLSNAEPVVVRTIAAHQGSARWVRISPDGKQLATCGNDLLVKLWNAETGEQLKEFAGHQRHVYGVDFHPGGTHLVSQDLMGVVKVWNIATGKEERTIDASVMTGYDNKFAADMGGSRDLHFRQDGAVWASAGITKVSNSFAGVQDPIIVLFNWETGTIQEQFAAAEESFKGIAWGVRFHPHGFLIGAAADRNGKGELWFYKHGEKGAFHTVKLPSAARGLDLIGEDRLAVAHADGAVRIYAMTAPPPAPEAEPEKAPAETEAKS